MATYLHFAPAVALAAAWSPPALTRRWLLLGMVCAVLPDADGAMHMLRLAHYSDTYGHRGFTHSLGFALLVGACAGLWHQWALRKQTLRRCHSHHHFRRHSLQLAAYLTLCTLSHPLIDGLINVGICNAWFWPLNGERHCLPWRPIPMRGVGLFGGERFIQECLWIGLPLVLMTALWRWARVWAQRKRLGCFCS